MAITEVALTRERPVENLHALLQSNLEELGRMRTMNPSQSHDSAAAPSSSLARQTP